MLRTRLARALSSSPPFPSLLRSFACSPPPPPPPTMVTLVVATTADPASIGPASALLSMPGWSPGPSLPDGIESYVNGDVRMVKHSSSIVAEDDLDRRWEAFAGEPVAETIFLSRHTAVSSRPALTVHPIGVPHLKDGDVLVAGGKPGWAGLPNPRIGPWLRLLKKIAERQGLVPEFEVTLEATHHGPVVSTPTMFVEIGSTKECWGRQDAAQAIALLLWEGLGLGGGDGVGNWHRNNDNQKVLLGLGGGHYVPRHMDIILKDGAWVGHLLSGYSLPMDDPNQKKEQNKEKGVGGTWKQAIKVSYEATQQAFPGGVILAHLDHKSFKSWQKNAITSFLAEQNIQVGKPSDFF
ncbi:D-aminoacyl-tRNA deacylase [Dioscorea cayenensis subsp. rotundata]|uniref:D-aminoacyl-tRNA deacylase n=1 Tax=Dioscorea cayennensis subsp. rotundata TaxID=55577 RepID=A0AB40CVK6_DIOCR|nr:D-aminoacyl-tRNA deacylase [Dioscorea cayenensis subsp. rotundata]